jgi:uncharacterized protein (DUF1330 family)
MAAWLIGHITVRDAMKWQDYVSQVGATIAETGGQVMFRGRLQDQLCGDAPGQLLVAIRFADMANLRKWHDSPAYQRLIPIRRAAADVVLSAYED